MSQVMCNQLISIIVTTYNHERFITEALDSILKIPYTHKEIIVIDDVSPDDTRTILKSYEDKVTVIYNEKNVGVQLSVKCAIERAKGTFLFIMSGDDVMLPNRIDRCLEIFRENPKVAIICSEADIIDENSKLTGARHTIPSFINNANIKIEQLKRNYCLGATMVIRNLPKLFQAPRLKDGIEDFPLALECLFQGYDIFLVKESLMQYRMHGNNLSVSKWRSVLEKTQLAYKRFEDVEILRYLQSNLLSQKEQLVTMGIIKCFIEAYEEGLAYLLKGLKIDSSDEKLLKENIFYTSVALFHLEQYDACKHILETNQQIVGALAEVNNNLGVLCIKVDKDRELAKQYLNKALYDRPSYRDATQNARYIEEEEKLLFTNRIMDINY